MKMAKALVILAAMAMCMGLGMAANYTVGGNGGWGEGIDYQTWASSITFVVGDNLIFRYMPNHNVNEVSKADFDSCSPDNPIQPPFNGGSAVITLTAPGTRYFICGTGGHCLNGMNVAINTVAASAPPPSIPPPPPATPPSVPPPPPATPPSVPPPPPATPPSVPPTSSPSVPSLPPTPSAHRPISSPPPLKSAAPSTPPTHSHMPAAPKVSPSKPPSKGSPALSPATAPTPGSSLPATPPTSSAAKINLLTGLIAGIGSVLLMFLNF